MTTIDLADLIEDNSNLEREFALKFLALTGSKAVLNLTMPAQDQLARCDALMQITNTSPGSNLLVLCGSKERSQKVVQPFLERYLKVSGKNGSLTYNRTTIFFEGYRTKTWKLRQYSYAWVLVGAESNLLSLISSRIPSKTIVVLAADQELGQVFEFGIPNEQILTYEGRGNLKSYSDRGG